MMVSTVSHPRLGVTGCCAQTDVPRISNKAEIRNARVIVFMRRIPEVVGELVKRK
jgi:hypothetical protein